jgi:hypothetical protein
MLGLGPVVVDRQHRVVARAMSPSSVIGWSGALKQCMIASSLAIISLPVTQWSASRKKAADRQAGASSHAPPPTTLTPRAAAATARAGGAPAVQWLINQACLRLQARWSKSLPGCDVCCCGGGGA